MSKCRVIGAGAGIGRANGGGGYNTGGNQGGGDALEGLVSTTNMRVSLVPYVRTRADGGNARNWVFCMNQLGGVGRRWGQAAGPGNRGGVHASCKGLAARSRQKHPRRPSQSSGYGSPKVHRANAVLPMLDAVLEPPASNNVPQRSLPDVGGHYGVQEYPYIVPPTTEPAPLPTPTKPIFLAPGDPLIPQDQIIDPAYNILVLGSVSFSASDTVQSVNPPIGIGAAAGVPSTNSDVVFNLRVPNPPGSKPLADGNKYTILTITVSNAAWAYSDGFAPWTNPQCKGGEYGTCSNKWDIDPTPKIVVRGRTPGNNQPVDPLPTEKDPNPAQTVAEGLYKDFKSRLIGWLNANDAWYRTRRAFISIEEPNPTYDIYLPADDKRPVNDSGTGTVSWRAFAQCANPNDPATDPPCLPPPSDTASAVSALKDAPATGMYRAALNLAYLMNDLCYVSPTVATEAPVVDCVGLDLTTRSSTQALALQNVLPLVDAFSALNYTKYMTRPHFRCSLGGIAAPAPAEKDAMQATLEACDYLAYPTAFLPPSDLGNGKLVIAPGLWEGFKPGPPSTWNESASDGSCAAMWLVREATTYLDSQRSLRNECVSVAATIATSPTEIGAGPDGWGDNGYTFENLVSSFDASSMGAYAPSCGKGRCPGIFTTSIEMQASDAPEFCKVAQQILNKLKIPQCPGSYKVSSTPSSDYDGIYVQATCSQKVPTTSFAPHAYVKLGPPEFDDQGYLRPVPTLYGSDTSGSSGGGDGPQWVISRVNLKTGTPDYLSVETSNPIYYAMCDSTTECGIDRISSLSWTSKGYTIKVRKLLEPAPAR